MFKQELPGDEKCAVYMKTKMCQIPLQKGKRKWAMPSGGTPAGEVSVEIGEVLMRYSARLGGIETMGGLYRPEGLLVGGKNDTARPGTVFKELAYSPGGEVIRGGHFHPAG